MQPTRRVLLGGTAALVGGGLAGCIGDTGGGDEDGSRKEAYTAFFTLESFTGAVAGDGLTVRNPIPDGELGHHYEVSTQAQLDVARSQAFVYAALPGFQRWAVDAAENLRKDHPEVTLVDAVGDIELLDANPHGGDGHDHESDETDHTHEEDGHDHGDFDPHFWLDPSRAIESVRTIRDGLAEADPDNAGTYEDNAEAYIERLSALDETFETELSERQLDTVVVASHDSYGYLAKRYGFEVHSPVGVSPNAEPGSAEIRDTIDIVEEHDIDTVLYDAFESPNLAETIVSDSGAEKAAAISSVAGTRTDWAENGWRYIEQMKEINLPAIKAALKAE